MIIKKQKKERKSRLVSLVAIIILLTIISNLSNKLGSSESRSLDSKERTIEQNNESLQINSLTQINDSATIEKVIQENIGLLHKDLVCSIYLTNFLGTPKLTYVYDRELKERELNDLFYVHLYLKDKSKMPASGLKFININEGFNPQKAEINEQKYYYSSVKIGDNFSDIDNIDYINTGRFLPGVSSSYSVAKIKINKKRVPLISNIYETLVISLKKEGYEKIKNKRNKALREEVLLTNDNDFVNATISLQNDTLYKKADLRLKGDWTDHLVDLKKWSFRIKLDGENTMFGTRKFSIQHPGTRNFLWEWYFNKVIKENDLVGLKYNFLNTIINVKSKDTIEDINLGIMAFEESFDKILIENNNRREGVLLAFNESYLWKDRNKAFKLNLPSSTWEVQGPIPLIRVFNEGKVLSTAKLLKQFNTAKGLIHEWKNGKLKTSEVFDIDKLTFFVALSNLFGGHHGLIWHNLRFYYNPITNKLEPVSFDSDSGQKINEIKNYVFSDSDPLYQKKLFENLELVSSQEFIDGLYNKYKGDLDEQLLNLATEYYFKFDFSILEYNSNFIKKELSLSSPIISSLKSFKNNKMILEVRNLSKYFTVTLDGLIKIGDKMLSKKLSSTRIKPQETKEIEVVLKNSFMNAFVSKKNKKGYFRFPKDLAKIKVAFKTLGSKNRKYSDITPFHEYDSLFLSKYLNLNKIESPRFVIKDELKKTFRFRTGSYIASRDIVIPAGYDVIIEEGFNLDLTNGASLISYSALNCEGTKQNPIRIYSSDSSGKGVFVSGANKKSKLNYCYFTNLSNPSNDLWELSGAVNFHETSVSIENSIFEKNRCEDGLNIIKSSFSMKQTVFRNSYSDAFDGDFVNGSMIDCEFINSGNDGIDISGSVLTINNIIISNSSDKAISAGEGSNITGSSIEIFGGEIGVVSKDLSKVKLDSVNIFKTRLGFSVFQKKSEFGPGIIEITNLKLLENELDYLVENNSKLILNNILSTTVSSNVIDKMYGKEYGKSSK